VPLGPKRRVRCARPVTRAEEERPRKLALQHSAREGCHTLTLLGELDHATAPELEAAIVRPCHDGAKEIVLDLRELSRIDSTGWRAIFAGEKSLRGDMSATSLLLACIRRCGALASQRAFVDN
jgi:anti-anti-sigma factor